MKKFLLILAVMISVTAMVFAGGSQNNSSSSVPTVKWTVDVVPPDVQEDNKIISKYILDTYGINVEWLYLDGDAATNLRMAGGDYDITFTDNGLTQYTKVGALLDITDLLELPELAALKASRVPGAWDGVRIDGRIYSIPHQGGSQTYYNVWNGEVVNDPKYPELKNIIKDGSIEGFDKAFRYLKAQGFPTRIITSGPGEQFGSNPVVWDGITGFNGTLMAVRYDDKTRKVIVPIDTPEFMYKLDIVHKWYVDGIREKDANTYDGPWNPQVFLTGSGWPGAATIWNGWMNSTVPAVPVEQVQGPFVLADGYWGSMHSIGVNSKNPVAALKVLQAVSTDSILADMLSRGIAGKHFNYLPGQAATKDKAGVYTRTGVEWQGMLDYQTGPSTIMQNGVRRQIKSSDSTDPNRTAEGMDQLNRATYSVMLGFVIDRTPTQNIQAQLTTIWDKYSKDLLSGYADPHVLIPTIMAELNNAGLQTVIADAQKQVDAWVKANNK
jgi:putative aldouronate transport system substrate-binding protein